MGCERIYCVYLPGVLTPSDVRSYCVAIGAIMIKKGITTGLIRVVAEIKIALFISYFPDIQLFMHRILLLCVALFSLGAHCSYNCSIDPEFTLSKVFLDASLVPFIPHTGNPNELESYLTQTLNVCSRLYLFIIMYSR